MGFIEADVDGEYCRSIRRSGRTYHLVLVDGRDRVNCVKQSIDQLSQEGVVLLDDSEREGYREGIEYACSRGFRRLDFEGLKPTGGKPHRTTIFYRSENCLGL